MGSSEHPRRPMTSRSGCKKNEDCCDFPAINTVRCLAGSIGVSASVHVIPAMLQKCLDAPLQSREVTKIVTKAIRLLKKKKKSLFLAFFHSYISSEHGLVSPKAPVSDQKADTILASEAARPSENNSNHLVTFRSNKSHLELCRTKD